MKIKHAAPAFLFVSLVVPIAFAQPHFGRPSKTGGPVSVLVVDSKGDGVELDAYVSTKLAGRVAGKVHWTAPGASDGFLVERIPMPAGDAEAAETAPVEQNFVEWHLVRPQVRRADGPKRTSRSERSAASEEREANPWAMLARFDTDGDGRLTTSDGGFDLLGIFTDTNGDGIVDDGELSSLAEAGVIALVLPASDAKVTTLEREDGSSAILRIVEIGM